jgi:2-C-methyl-D-erythritol 2,4-cyclodiphosphate synthase
MGQPDIGELFPDNDPQFKGIASLQLLRQVKEILVNNNFEILNIDCVLIIETPKISPFKNEIKKNIAATLQIPQTDFNMKAKTREKLGAIGRGEALECFSTVIIRSLV